MTTGSCVCGAWTYSFTGVPAAVVICHCRPCTKTAGQNGSTNAIIPNPSFTHLSGPSKTWTRKGDSGKDVTYNSCATCGTIMWVDVEAMPGVTVVKSGTFDDREVLGQAAPGLEMYCRDRPGCFAEYPGIEHKEVA